MWTSAPVQSADPVIKEQVRRFVRQRFDFMTTEAFFFIIEVGFQQDASESSLLIIKQLSLSRKIGNTDVHQFWTDGKETKKAPTSQTDIGWDEWDGEADGRVGSR